MLSTIAAHPWAITEEWHAAILEASRHRVLDPSAIATKRDEPLATAPSVRVRDGVAIISVNGPLSKGGGGLLELLFGGESYESIARRFVAALEDPDVRAILFDVDSPGGDATGPGELSDIIFRARGRKPIVAYAGGYCCSAAYWIASACDRIVADESAIVGSIGVRLGLVDASKAEEQDGIRRIRVVSSQSPYKVTDPTNADDIARVQKMVDDLATVFVGAVALHRGVSAKTVLADYGKGDVLVGKVALDAGLVDELGSFESTLAQLSNPGAVGAAFSGGPSATAITTERDTPMAKVKCSKCGDEMDTDDDDVYCGDCADAEALAKELGGLKAELVAITGKPDLAEAIGALRAYKASHEQLASANAELERSRAEKLAADFGALVEQGKKDRKLTPHQVAEAAKPESWLGRMRARGADGIAELRAFLAEAAPIASATPVAVEADPKGIASAMATLTDEEIKVCKVMGLDPEQYKKSKVERLTGAAK